MNTTEQQMVLCLGAVFTEYRESAENYLVNYILLSCLAVHIRRNKTDYTNQLDTSAVSACVRWLLTVANFRPHR